MRAHRTYDDPCGAARALDFVGERWALLVVRELLLGPKRFNELRNGLGAISENVLSQRLRELDAAGIVRRRRSGPPASAQVYELTQRGAELEPVILALAAWGFGNPIETNAQLSPDALMLLLKATFDPARAKNLEANVELRINDDRFDAQISERSFTVERGNASHPDASLQTNVSTLRELIDRGRSLDDALNRGDLTLEGDRKQAARFLRSFGTPGEASMPNA